MEKLLDQVSFEAPDLKERRVVIDREDVHRTLAGIIQDEDLSRYIL
jgi:ATP-dependent HslUV protease ATP-binding subunit HslU